MTEGNGADMDDETDDIRELLALAAVGALDRDEEARLRERIADRPDLRAELAGYDDAAAFLADAVAETPPPALRAMVLSAIHDVRQAGGHDRAVSLPPPMAPVVAITSGRRRRWAPVAAIAGAAAAAILAVVAVGALTGSDDDDVQVADVVADADAVTTPFAGQEDGFRLVHSPDFDAVALIGDDIPELAAQQVYELWLVRGDRPEKMEIFHPDADGDVEVLIPGVTPPDDATFAITIEPPGGSEQPTSTAIASTA